MMTKSYSLVRRVHQWAAFVLASFIAMYAVTGLVLIYPGVIPDRWSIVQTTSREVEVQGLPSIVEASGLTDESTSGIVAVLAEQLGIRGRLDAVETAGSTLTLTFARPGTVEKIQWTPGNPVVIFESWGGSLRGTLNRLHHLDGYRGGRKFWLWAAMVDIVSLSMFLFAGSGIYLWYVRKKADRRLGWVILTGGTFFVLGSTAYLLLGK